MERFKVLFPLTAWLPIEVDAVNEDDAEDHATEIADRIISDIESKFPQLDGIDYRPLKEAEVTYAD